MTKFSTKALVAVAALGFALTAGSGSASAFDKNSGTEAQRQACTWDAISYCMNSNVDAIVACLKKDRRVSKKCKAVVNGSGH